MSCSEIKSSFVTECGDGKDFALAQFARHISTVGFDDLKRILKHHEEKEYYEECDIIQKEIDFRIELAARGWK